MDKVAPKNIQWNKSWNTDSGTEIIEQQDMVKVVKNTHTYIGVHAGTAVTILRAAHTAT